MKRNKLLALLLAVLLCLSIPTVAFADGEGPHFSEINATVEKESGIPFYNYDYDNPDEKEWALKPTGVTIPKGTALTLNGEFDEDGVLYFSLEYQDEYGYVRKDDVRMELTEVAPADENAYAAPRHYVVVAQDGAQVHKGPGNAFDVVKTLPRGKEITVTHADDLSPDDGYSIWDYSPEARGWVQTGDDREGDVVFAQSVKYKESSRTPLGTVKTRKETPVYAKISDAWNEEESTPLATIPAGEELTFELYYNNYAYVTYQGKTGWLPLWSNVEAPVDGYLMTMESKPLYKEAAVNETTGTGKTVEAYQILPYDLSVEKSIVEGLEPGDEDFYEQPYDTWYRVTVDGTQYWARFNSETNRDPLVFYYGRKSVVAETSNLLLFEEPDTSSQRIGKIPGEAQMIELFDYYISEEEAPESTEKERNWHYVVYGDLRGWTCYNYDEVDYGDDDGVFSLASFLADPAENAVTDRLKPAATKPTGDAATEAQKADGDNMTVKAPARTIILGCVAAAVILALVAAVTIALIKKRKSAAKDDAPPMQ